MEELTLEDFKKTITDLDQYPLQYINSNRVIKLKDQDGIVTIGFTEQTSESILIQLEDYHKDRQIDFIKISSSEITSYISKLTTNIGDENRENIKENDLNRLANDAPIVNLVNSIIIDGINSNASDIHIESYQKEVNLRYRIDGVLILSTKIKKNLFSAISSRIKIMANLNIMERRQPQDGRCSVNLDNKPVDLRVSTVPLSGGESIVLRLFIKKNRLITLQELGFRDDKIELLSSMTKLSHGLILVTGPTGSGKTTTLNALLQMVNSEDKKIITIEDPVEYSINGVNQIEVNSDIDLGFSNILRRVLRQDPDIIMIGEIRDSETAELVIRAALTGHLVLSTLHTNDAVSAISRLKDFGVADYLITSVLKASIAQRLVRRCSKTGFSGRMVISEGFQMDSKLETIILNNGKPYEIQHYLNSLNMVNLKTAGDIAVKSGLTTKGEIERVLSC